MEDTTLLTAPKYIDDLVAKINKSKRRVTMIALVISEDKATKSLIDALCNASERGVIVNVAMDLYFTYKEIEASAKRMDYIQKQSRALRATKKRLNKSGVHVRWLGQYGFLIISRRTHTKWSVVDDTVYSFGGVNLHHSGIKSVDYMLRTTDKRLAERIAAEHDFVIATDNAKRAYPSHTIDFNDEKIHIDGGRLFDSAIYERVLELASQSKSAIYVSQYCPTGRLANLLNKIDTEYYFNSPENAHDFMNKALIKFAMARTGIKTKYTNKRYLHAKCIIFTLENNQKVAISGSHNFVGLGVIAGTREAALETKDPKIIAQLESFIEKEVKS